MQFLSDLGISSTHLNVQRPLAIWDEIQERGETHLLRDEKLIEDLQNYYLQYDFAISAYLELPKETRFRVRYLTGDGASLESIDAWWMSL